MLKLEGFENLTPEEKYENMLLALEGQLTSESDSLANLSNASAIIMGIIDRINWAGFYLLRNNELVLGPFQGLPACNRIAVGRGVCGTAAESKKTQRVYNVHEFSGHIACDCATNSEIVIPIIKNETVYGVLDIDSPEIGRFTELEENYLVLFVDKLIKHIDFEAML